MDSRGSIAGMQVRSWLMMKFPLSVDRRLMSDDALFPFCGEGGAVSLMALVGGPAYECVANS